MSKKIIIAEDSSVIQNLTRKILSIQNYEIISVKNGRDVLKKLDEYKCDLVLLDINMPIMDGIEREKQIRSHSKESIKNIPIIAISGNAKNYTLEDFKSMGINDYLP